MSLYEGNENDTYKISDITTADEEFRAFLFSLGCYKEESITIISRKKHNMVVAVKDGRYNIDNDIAKLISVA